MLTPGKGINKAQWQKYRDSHSDMSKMILLAYKRVTEHHRKNGEGCWERGTKETKRKRADKGRTKAPKRNFCPRT